MTKYKTTHLPPSDDCVLGGIDALIEELKGGKNE